MIHKPHVDWFALSPSLSLLAAVGAAAARRGLLAEGLTAGRLGDRLRDRLRDRVRVRDPPRREEPARRRDRRRLDLPRPLGRDRADHHRRLRRSSPCSIAYGERRREENIAEYYALLAAAGAGMSFFVQAANLMTLFLGLEWFSIALYVMCAIDIDLVGSLEAGLKYLMIGAVGSATLLFGSALVYGATGQLSFDKIGAAGHAHDSLLVLGLAMMIAGLAFKASAAPFHMWTPDAYQGAPTPVTAFMSSATKVAALVVTYRVLVTAFPGEQHLWTWAIAVIAMHLARGRQHRRARAAQREAAARLLVGLARGLHADRRSRRRTRLGAQALIYYLIPYCAMSLGAFAVIAARERELGAPVTLDNLAGFGWERPFFGVSMWVFMLGFLGFPLTGGFIGKIYVFAPRTSTAGGG